MNVALVYNPRAGTILRRPALLDEVLAILRASFGEVDAIPTTGPATAGPLALEAARRGAGTVVVWGGDGTVNDAAQSLERSGTVIGVLPGGTACVLANELGLGVDPVRAAARLAGFVPREVATGSMIRPDGSRRAFVLMAGIGFDARIVHGLDLALKDRVGKLAYWAGAVRQLGTELEEFEVEAGGVRRRCAFALASRVRCYGGAIPLSKGASILSDSLEVTLFRGRQVWRYPLYFLALLAGLPRLAPSLERMSVSRLAASPREGETVHVQLDGEYAGTIPASFEVVPAAIRLLVPPGFRG